MLWLVLVALAACKSSGNRVLYEGDSPFSHLVVREEAPGIRTLQFAQGGATQSRVNVDDPMDLQLEYTRAGMLAWALKPKAQRIFVLGLGGGAMPSFLHRALPDAVIDVAELDPEVHALAQRYFGLPADERLKVHVGDGRRYVEAANAQWDLVILDAYSDSEIPRHLATAEFLAELKRHLLPDAVVSGNVWAREHNPLRDAMASAWQQAFGSLCIVGVENSANQIFLSTPGVALEASAVKRAAEQLTGWPPVKEYAPAECLRDGWEDAEPLRDP